MDLKFLRIGEVGRCSFYGGHVRTVGKFGLQVRPINCETNRRLAAPTVLTPVPLG